MPMWLRGVAGERLSAVCSWGHTLSLLCRGARAAHLPQCISGDTIIWRLGEESRGMRQPNSDSHKPLATLPNEFFPHIWPKCFGFYCSVFRGKRKNHIFSIKSKCCFVKRKPGTKLQKSFVRDFLSSGWVEWRVPRQILARAVSPPA